jgi:hypothetical protein
MGILPIVTKTYFTERDGVLRIARELNDYGLIFRETPNCDVGIDGLIEYVNNENQAIGKIIAVQIKSGDSYLNDNGDFWDFYPSEKHKLYWESYPIPVLILAFSPLNNKTYYVDAKYQLSNPDKSGTSIKIPKCNVLSINKKDDLFESYGKLNEAFLSIEDVFIEMIKRQFPESTFPISYFDLYIFGLTNICRQLFFSMSLACDIAEYYNNTGFGISIGVEEHKFLHNYVKFIVSQNLARIDYGDYLIDWRERDIQPMFLAALTQRGRELMDYIRSKENILNEKLPETSLVCERFLILDNLISEITRLEKAKMFKNLFEK